MEQLTSEQVRCEATTRKGTQCSRPATHGDYCWQHGGDDWRQLEIILARIQRQLVPDAEVRHDHWIRGKSGSMRKLDIAVYQQAGPYSLLIAFDCKRHSRPVKREKVVVFEEQLNDVNAHLGVMVSSAGFDEGAKTFVAGKRIILQSYREATATDWRDVLGASAWVTIVAMRPRELNAIAYLAADTNPARIPLETIIFNASGESEIPVRELCERVIIEQQLPPGSFGFKFAFLGGSAFIEADDKLLELNRLTAWGQAVGEKYIVNLHLAEGHVLENESSGRPIYADLTSTTFNWLDVISNQVGEEVTANEYSQLMQSSGFTARLEQSHPYIRVQAISTGDDIADFEANDVAE